MRTGQIVLLILLSLVILLCISARRMINRMIAWNRVEDILPEHTFRDNGDIKISAVLVYSAISELLEVGYYSPTSKIWLREDGTPLPNITHWKKLSKPQKTS
jgi:hypothetical protein